MTTRSALRRAKEAGITARHCWHVMSQTVLTTVHGDLWRAVLNLSQLLNRTALDADTPTERPFFPVPKVTEIGKRH